MVTVYLEGGGDAAILKSQCRHAFSDLLGKAGFTGKMPAVKALGSRQAAFDAFGTAHDNCVNGELNILLVDSETFPASNDAWAHLKSHDDWSRPNGATAEQAQLMVVCMETWLMADRDAFEAYFGANFKKDKLPTTDLEKRSKPDVYDAIAMATSTTKPKGKYGKARDSFKLLSQIDPKKLRSRCAWADRFFETLTKHC